MDTIAIVGTSSSVSKFGWTEPFKALEKESIVDNFSSGGNCSLYGNFIIDHYQLAKSYDYIILDFSINDQNFLIHNFNTKAKLKESFRSLLYKIISTGRTVPIVLIFGEKQYFYKNTFVARDIHIEICTEMGVPYLDFFGVAKKIDGSGLSPYELYSDEMHFSEIFFKCLALQLHLLKQTARSQFNRSTKILCNIKKDYIALSPSSFKGIKPDQIIRGNSFIQHPCYSIKKNDTLFFSAKQGRIEGFFYYSSSTSGIIEIKGDTNLSKGLGAAYKNMFFFKRILKDVFIKSPGLTITVTGKYQSEPDLPVNHQVFPFFGDEGDAEIVGILIRSDFKSAFETNEDWKNDQDMELVIDETEFADRLNSIGSATVESKITRYDSHVLGCMCYLLSSSSTVTIDRSLSLAKQSVLLDEQNPHFNLHYATLLDKNNSFEGKSYFERALQLAPHNAQFHFLFSLHCKRSGDDSIGIKHAEKAVRLAKNNPLYLSNYGELLFDSGNYLKAGRIFEQAIHVNPSNPDNYFKLGKTLFYCDLYEEAYLAVSRAISLDDCNQEFQDFFNILKSHNGTCFEFRDITTSGEEFKQAQAISHFNASQIHQLNGHFEKAISECKKAIEYSPESPYFLGQLAVLLDLTQQIEDGKKVLEMALKRYPDIPELHIEYCLVLVKLGFIENAWKEFQYLGEIKWVTPLLCIKLIEFLIPKGCLDCSEKIACKGVHLFPDNPHIRLAFGKVLMRQKRSSDALAEMNRAIKFADFFPHFYVNLGILYLEMNDFNSAESALTKSIWLDPKLPGAYMHLSRLYEKTNNIHGAIQAVKNAILLDDSNLEYHRKLDNLYSKNQIINKGQIH